MHPSWYNVVEGLALVWGGNGSRGMGRRGRTRKRGEGDSESESGSQRKVQARGSEK